MKAAAVAQVVAIDDVMTAYWRFRRATARQTRAGSAVSSSFGLPCVDRAICAGACADVAQDHERRRAVVPGTRRCWGSAHPHDTVLSLSSCMMPLADVILDPGARTFTHSGFGSRGRTNREALRRTSTSSYRLESLHAEVAIHLVGPFDISGRHPMRKRSSSISVAERQPGLPATRSRNPQSRRHLVSPRPHSDHTGDLVACPRQRCSVGRCGSCEWLVGRASRPWRR